MLEAFYQGLLAIFHWPTFGYMLIGIFVGFWVGLLPGLGGGTTLALMLPFIYGMDPISGFAFLLGMHAVVATTGDITSILFGVPGEGVSAATVASPNGGLTVFLSREIFSKSQPKLQKLS